MDFHKRKTYTHRHTDEIDEQRENDQASESKRFSLHNMAKLPGAHMRITVLIYLLLCKFMHFLAAVVVVFFPLLASLRSIFSTCNTIIAITYTEREREQRENQPRTVEKDTYTTQQTLFVRIVMLYRLNQ